MNRQIPVQNRTDLARNNAPSNVTIARPIPMVWQHLMRVLMQRRYWIIGSIVMCVLLVGILTMMMPTYASTATRS